MGLIEYLVKSAAILALLYLPYILWYARQTSFRFNRFYLLLALAVGLILPLGHALIDVSLDSRYAVLLDPVTAVDTVLANTAELPEQTSGWTILAGIYLLVSAVFVGRLIFHFAKLYLLARSGVQSVYRGHVVVRSPRVASPFSFWDRIYIPEGTPVDTKDGRSILDHEIAHLENRHSIDILAIELLLAVFWVNPLLYLYRSSLKDTHEFQADDYAGKGNVTEYARLLLACAQPGLAMQLSHQFITPQIKKRIIMMTRNRSKKKQVLNYIIALPLLLSVIFFGLFKAVPVNAQVTDQEVYKVVEKMPQFPGCENVAAEEQRQCSFNKLVDYVANNLRYPESARKDNIEGKVVVKFVVEATGVVSGIQVVRSLTADCDTEVIRVMESMNSMPVKWHPGEQKGEKVPVEMVLPVQFAL